MLLDIDTPSRPTERRYQLTKYNSHRTAPQTSDMSYQELGNSLVPFKKVWSVIPKKSSTSLKTPAQSASSR